MISEKVFHIAEKHANLAVCLVGCRDKIPLEAVVVSQCWTTVSSYIIVMTSLRRNIDIDLA